MKTLPSPTREVYILHVKGEVDHLTGPIILRDVHHAADAGHDVMLDFTDVEYFDGGGLRLLEDSAARLAARGRRLVVVAPPTRLCRRVITLTGLGQLMPVVDSRTAALTHLRRQGT